jgi:integrative and conjugative element protein (TIGR02256 family)
MAPLETGGILLGYCSEGGDTAVITTCIGPGPQASRSRASFVPDHDFHLAEVARHYDETGRREVYLGDWHSHPGGAAYLSRTDRRTAQRIARDGGARLATPLMLVVAGPPWNLAVWCMEVVPRFACLHDIIAHPLEIRPFSAGAA